LQNKIYNIKPQKVF